MHSRVHDTASGDAWQGRHLSSSSRVAGRSGTAQSRVRACGGCRTTSGSRWSGARSLLGPSHERILHRTPRVRMPDARTGRWDHRCRGSSHGLTVDIRGLRTGVERARSTARSTASCGSSAVVGVFVRPRSRWVLALTLGGPGARGSAVPGGAPRPQRGCLTGRRGTRPAPGSSRAGGCARRWGGRGTGPATLPRSGPANPDRGTGRGTDHIPNSLTGAEQR